MPWHRFDLGNGQVGCRDVNPEYAAISRRRNCAVCGKELAWGEQRFTRERAPRRARRSYSAGAGSVAGSPAGAMTNTRNDKQARGRYIFDGQAPVRMMPASSAARRPTWRAHFDCSIAPAARG